MEHQQDPSVKIETAKAPDWERKIIEKLALAAVTEQTRARRWGIFFKSLIFVYLFAVFGVTIYPKIKQHLGSD
ncbi:MAG: hypothetical protein RIS10_1391, partial [Pseudomonadota bacterium]